ncbi:MAG: hypothetical protein MUO63_05500 [Desulfobulbaceae bacterium]|nr:hypothetical protein [Desulfobulbaceae bacterium]
MACPDCDLLLLQVGVARGQKYATIKDRLRVEGGSKRIVVLQGLKWPARPLRILIFGVMELDFVLPSGLSAGEKQRIL